MKNTKPFNVIEEALKELNESLLYWSKDFADNELRGLSNSYTVQHLMVKKFLLNLVEAYQPNIQPYLTKDIKND